MKNDEAKDSSTHVLFSQRQRSVIAAGVTALCAACVMGFVVLLGWLLLRFLDFVSVVLMPLVVAWIFSIILKPYYTWLYRHLWRSHLGALSALLFSAIIPVIFVTAVFGSLIVKQLLALIDALPHLYQSVMTWVHAESPNLQAFLAKCGLVEQFDRMMKMDYIIDVFKKNVSGSQVGATAIAYGAGALRYVFSLLGWIIVPVYLVYFLVARALGPAAVVNHLSFLKRETRTDLVFLLEEFLRIIAAYFRGQLMIAMIQGVLFGLGFWLVGLPYGLVLGLSLGCLNLIPYLGNLVGLSVALPMAYFSEGGSLTRLVLVLGVFCVVQVLDGYWITPKIQSKGTGLSDVAIIFSLFFWGVIFQGMLGVLLAIPLSAFFVVLWRLLKRKYIREVL